MLIAKVILALLSVITGLGVILSPQAVNSALFLTCNLLCVAVFYLLMSAHFLGAAQLVIYAGAIMVVFLFAVTILAPEGEKAGKWNESTRLAGLIVASLLGGALVATMSVAPVASPEMPPTFPSQLKVFAAQLFGKYVFAFESTAFILLVALIGIVLLGHRRLKDLDRGGPSRD